jgi:hypothetical protein
VADDVSKGEYENLLVREIELRQGTLEVEDAHIAAVCFTPAAFFPAGEFNLARVSVAECGAFEGPLFEQHDCHHLV